MENFKVKVLNEAESKEVQELFFQLGYPWFGTSEQVHQSRIGMFFTTKYNSVNIISYDQDYSIDLPNHKEITIAELRDMVVLKRNDIGDATHAPSIGYKQYHASNGDVYQYLHNGWNFSHNKSPIQKGGEIDKPIEPKSKSLDKLSIGEVNYRTAQAFNQAKGANDLITEDDVRLISELIELVKCHGASNETDMPF